jgi:hypothetical protein
VQQLNGLLVSVDDPLMLQYHDREWGVQSTKLAETRIRATKAAEVIQRDHLEVRARLSWSTEFPPHDVSPFEREMHLFRIPVVLGYTFPGEWVKSGKTQKR